MDEGFPGEDKLAKGQNLAYSRKAIRKAARIPTRSVSSG
jgi:hypothetical protein